MSCPFPIRILDHMKVTIDSQFELDDQFMPSLNSINSSIAPHSTVIKGHTEQLPTTIAGCITTKEDQVTIDVQLAGHDVAIKAEIVKLSQLIPLKLSVNEYYNNKGIDVSQAQQENEFFNVVFIDNVPQQSHESLDCGIYMLAFAEYLSYGQARYTSCHDTFWMAFQGAFYDLEAAPSGP
uniref:Ubiquitin-like protease family profile domain-containing protein n=1 Tax=Solanum lycopersicum TaxID=4081 RepID=A0A3Q7FKX5_SOLLC